MEWILYNTSEGLFLLCWAISVPVREPLEYLLLAKKKRKGDNSMDSIIASVITGGLALVGVIFTNIMSNQKIEHKLEVNQAITDTKLDNLSKEVKEHNSNVQQVPVLIEKVNNLEMRIDRVEHNGQ